MPTLYLQHQKTARRYQIVRIDRTRNVIQLRSEAGTEFEEPYDKDRIKQMGYELVTEDA